MRNAWRVALTVTTLALVGAWYVRARPFLDPESALHEFENYDAHGDQQLTDPLILCGGEVVPLVITGLADRSLSRRPWAAAFLGNGRYPEAAPVLSALALDTTEHSQTRRYALASLERIDPQQAERVEAEMRRNPQSGAEPIDVFAEQSASHERSYLEALLSLGD